MIKESLVELEHFGGGFVLGIAVFHGQDAETSKALRHLGSFYLSVVQGVLDGSLGIPVVIIRLLLEFPKGSGF